MNVKKTKTKTEEQLLSSICGDNCGTKQGRFTLKMFQNLQDHYKLEQSEMEKKQQKKTTKTNNPWYLSL